MTVLAWHLATKDQDYAFARPGLVAEHGTPWLLPRLIGMHNACDLLYSGRLIGAEEALRMGLVNRVVPHDTLLPTVREVKSSGHGLDGEQPQK